MNSKLKIETRVRSLKNYLTEFENGAFQIPSFQRDFLWNQDDIKELFDSIKNSFPIGSILFWKPLESENSWINRDETYIGPYKIIKQYKKEPTYILDGFQRLSSLFGCLTNPNKYNNESLNCDQKKWNEKFNLLYDLETENFIFSRKNTIHLPQQVPVFVFMNSIDFRQYARKNFELINNENKIETYYDRADAMGQIFQNYQIASVDITQATIEDAVEIFKRVNERGLPISKDWIVSALTNNETFRLGSEIDLLIEDLKKYNFDKIKRDILFQCIQNSFGKIYFDFKIEELVKRQDFISNTLKTIEAIKDAVKFLFEYLLVFDCKLLPYNSQLVFLSSFFLKNKLVDITDHQILELKKWFWKTTYSNYFTIYSLSDQRKAFEKFSEFISNSNMQCFYNGAGEIFSTMDFPQKIIRGSVRSKALTLFMINNSLGISEINLKKVNADEIDKLVDGKVFNLNQKDSRSENYFPNVISSLSKFNDRKKTIFLDILLSNNDNYFISKNILYLSINSDLNNINTRNEILSLRRNEIVLREKKFVESLGLYYSLDY